MYDLESIPLPLHPKPSPSAPPISYSHNCINDNPHASDAADEYKMGATLYNYRDDIDPPPGSPTSGCVRMVRFQDTFGLLSDTVWTDFCR
jgi:hypothetical protein